MKVVILTAGMGKRLGGKIPKPLTALVGDKTILDYQIENLQKFVSLEDILLVVGYKKEIILEKYPSITHVCNDNYAETNTSKSLLLALEEIDNDDVLWLNGDIYFDGSLLTKIIGAKDSSVLVDNKKCGEEEVKYCVDSDGNIEEISKTIKNAQGEALGINLMKKKDLSLFKKHLRLVDDNDYFEKALENMIKQDKVEIQPINIEKYFCQEIDFPEDLQMVKQYLNGE